MDGAVLWEALLWLGGLFVALGASEALVHALTALGRRTHISLALLGLLVALGADAPEITSALLALGQGSTDVGAGVLLGSNIYNLAGLLGLSALLGGSLSIGGRWLTNDMIVNVVLTLGAVSLLASPSARLLFALLIFLIFLVYVTLLAGAFRSKSPRLTVRSQVWENMTFSQGREQNGLHSRMALVVALIGGVAAIVAGSAALVHASLVLAPRFGVPSSVTGTIVLAVATSLPNTWAAISLARRHLGLAAIAATFSSNSINLVAGLAVPSLLITLHTSAASVDFDSGWLLGMTACALALLGFRHALTRIDGAILIALYAGFVILRIALPT